MKSRLALIPVLLALTWQGFASAPSLIPDTPNTSPDYYCTWGLQGFKCGWADTTQQSDRMNETDLFSKGQGYAELYPEARGDLLLVLDDTWDIPLGGNRSHPMRGSLIVDAGRFPSFQGTPVERLTKLNKEVCARGWRGLGLWIFTGRAKALQNPNTTTEQYWAERLQWSREAGIAYWKADWGSMGPLEIWRLNQWANRIAPGIWVEHGAIAKTGARIWQTDKLDVHRTYDVNDHSGIPLTIQRIAQVIRYPRADHSARGLINCEDDVMIGAGTGCTYGVMRYPVLGDSSDSIYEKNHSPEKRGQPIVWAVSSPLLTWRLVRWLHTDLASVLSADWIRSKVRCSIGSRRPESFLIL